MPRKPKATSPSAKTAGASMSEDIDGPHPLTKYAMDISETMLSPSQYALKFPATKPARMLSDAPPSFEAVTTSRTWLDSTEVNTFTSSGMIAPASVPHVMIADSFHQSVPSPRSAISKRDTANVRVTDTMDVSQTSCVSGASKFIFDAEPYRAFAIASFNRYDPTLAMII